KFSERLAVSSLDPAELVPALQAFADEALHPKLLSSSATGNDLPVAFVYSGNGSQWAGMGLAAYRRNETFRRRFEEIDSLFDEIAGWSLKEKLFDEGLNAALSHTTVAQPLIFAIQCALTAALGARGLKPSLVLGQSVGEVAAAHAAGAL